jgi:hypothetical protein
LEVLKAGHFFTVLDFIDREEADIEDVFAPELFVEILNKAYAVPKAKKITVASLKIANEKTTRQVKQAEAIFALLPECDEFDHFAPAAWLMRNLELLDADTNGVNDTLDRAEAIFKAFNKLLP